MTFFERLMQETKSDRDAFQTISLIQTAVCQGVDKNLYVAFLTQAYHHVKFTCPLLGAALSRVGQNDGLFRTALIEYIDEEKGHEEWILDDIEAFGGDRQAVVNQAPNISTNVMCGYAFYAIEHVSPYALLGMVHVLEGMSVALATQAAGAIFERLQLGDGAKGFSYLRSHGSLDVEHTDFFEDLVNKIEDASVQDTIIASAKIFYRLYGDIFRELETQSIEAQHAA